MMKSVKKLIKSVMLIKEIKSGYIANELEIDKQFFYNWLYKPDTEAFQRLIAVADALGCDLAFVDRKTGEVYK